MSVLSHIGSNYLSSYQNCVNNIVFMWTTHPQIHYNQKLYTPIINSSDMGAIMSQWLECM